MLQPMFDAWAGVAGVPLFPGTAYLCAEAAVQFPKRYISLTEFEHLHSAQHRRRQPGYSPRLYPIELSGCILAWIFRWSDDDPGLGFIGDLGDCEAPRLLEVIAPVSIKVALAVPHLAIRFVAA